VNVAFDANFLLLVLKPDRPYESAPGQPIPLCKERIEHLIASLSQEKARILIPAPAFSEVLVHDDKKVNEWIEALQSLTRFEVGDFDRRAAIELAIQTRKLMSAGDKRGGGTESWQKIRLDRQIAAIAKVNQCERLYSNDKGLVSFANAIGITTTRVEDLPIPASAQQMAINLGEGKENGGQQTDPSEQ